MSLEKIWGPKEIDRGYQEGFVLISNEHYYLPKLIGTFVKPGPHDSTYGTPYRANRLVKQLAKKHPDDPFYQRAIAASVYLRITR